MGLAHKLLGREHLKIGGHYDVLSVLDNTLVKKRQMFSLRKAKLATKALMDALTTGDRGRFLVAFAALAEIMYAPEAKRSGKVHPSRLDGDCERRMYYEMTDVVPTGAPSAISPQTQRIFDLGTWFHTYLQILFLQSGLAEGIEVRVENLSLDIDGRADVVTIVLEDKKYLVEIKTCNSNTYRQVKGTNKPLAKHISQASIYASILKLDWLLFLYVNKDTCEILQIHTPTDVKSYKNAVKKITDVQKAIEAEEVPERVCHTAHTTTAMGCEYCKHCFKY